MLTYNTELKTINQSDKDLVISLLKQHLKLVNLASKLQFGEKTNSIKTLHKAFYYPTREQFPDAPSQVVIKAEQECLASYRSIKSNKHEITKPFEKKNLSMRLDIRTYSRSKEKTRINVITTEGRKWFEIALYPKLQELFDKYDYCDPLIFVRDGKLMIALTFDNEPKEIKPSLALGVDLGIRRTAACSDGRLIIDKKFNKKKRKLRDLKRQLRSVGTKSSRKRLRKLKHKERNKNKNQTHLVANEILKTKANVIVLENLKGIKAKKHKYQNKNAISQVPLFFLRTILTYKAKNMGKHVCLVSPAYTSQIDNVSGIREGERKGCRFYAKGGLVYDADLNAAINIARRSKLPISHGNIDRKSVV